MKHEENPLSFLIGTWESTGFTGENQAPDPDRRKENTKYKQQMTFTPTDPVSNHEQDLYSLRYSTFAWEEGDEEEAFHEEVGYWIWDAQRQMIMKCFTIPRGISVLAGGPFERKNKEFQLSATRGDPVFGICSNPFLDIEFQTIRYDLKVLFTDQNTLTYEENSQIQIRNQEKIFHHTEKNILKRIKASSKIAEN